MKEVIETAQDEKLTDITTLSTGYRARLKPVSARLLQSVMSRIQTPEPPIIFDEAKGRKVIDEFDPDYLKASSEVASKRAAASLDTMAMFGIELVDPVPPDDEWLSKLKLFASIGYLDLEEYDLEDATVKEFLFKRFIVLGNTDLVAISKLSGIQKKDLQAAEEIFQGDKGRNTN